MSPRRALTLALTLAAAWSLGGCGVESGPAVDRFGPDGDATLPKRRGSVVVEGCALDGYQADVLAGAAARAVLQEIVLVCPTLDEHGAVAPQDDATRATLGALVAKLRAQGYRVLLAIGARDTDGSTPAPAPLARRFDDESYWTASAQAVVELAPLADGIELALPPMATSARGRLTAWTRSIAGQIRPARRLGLFAPPSYTEPSDIPYGGTWDVAALAPSLDRVRLMTVDYTDPAGPAGPTTDPGWAVQVLATARAKAPGASFDLTLPLYGWDYSRGGAAALSYLDATALAQVHGVAPTRLPIGEPTFSYVDSDGAAHTVVYDDALSLTRALLAWDTATVSADVGVTYYGLGAEDPALFPRLASGRGGAP